MGKIGNGGYPGAVKITPEGGFAVQMINATGAATVKGTVVVLAGTSFSCTIADVSANDGVGVIYENGIAVGGLVWVVYLGLVDVLLEDNTPATAGNWVGVSTTQAGRANAENTAPPASGTFPEVQQHFTEIGHCFESKTAGTNVLARCNVHWN